MLKELKETDLAYIAGLLDGEGYIGIVGRGEKQKGYRATVTISSTNSEIILWLKSVLDGSVYQSTHRNKRWKDSWEWKLSTRNVIPLLTSLIPYLKIKKTQASLVCEFQGNVRLGGYKSKMERDIEEVFHSKSLVLNKKGALEPEKYKEV